MKMIPQPYQQQQGAGGIIIVHGITRTAVSAPGFQANLPPDCAAKLKSILAKPDSSVTDAERTFVAQMVPLAHVWPQL